MTISNLYLKSSGDVALAEDHASLHANQLDLTPEPADDRVARFLAYTSPYLFWGTIAVLSLGVVIVR